jgi:hypothetical protein
MRARPPAEQMRGVHPFWGVPRDVLSPSSNPLYGAPMCSSRDDSSSDAVSRRVYIGNQMLRLQSPWQPHMRCVFNQNLQPFSKIKSWKLFWTHAVMVMKLADAGLIIQPLRGLRRRALIK